MTDEGLRIRAAELMGWKRRYHDSMWFDRGVDSCLPGELPDYPNDIVAAWELLRALPEDMTMTIYPGRMVILEQSAMFELPGLEIVTPMYSEIARFIGDSDERNITRAFIRAREENHE